MDWIDALNLAGSASSIVLALFSIALSVYFFVQSKNTEGNVAEMLSGIKQQVDSLQRLTGRWMDRLTKYATEHSPYEETVHQFAAVLRELPNSIASGLRLPQSQGEIDRLTSEAVAAYIAAYYYTALTNVLAQDQLPDKENFDVTSSVHTLIKDLIDSSAKDFLAFQGILNGVNEQVVRASANSHLLDATNHVWGELVKNSADVYAARSGRGA